MKFSRNLVYFLGNGCIADTGKEKESASERASERAREREIERRRAEAKGWLEKAVKSGARFGSLDRGTREERLSDGGRWPRGGGGGVQSVRGKERRARRCRVTERRESECHWRCIQPAAKTVLRHLDPLSGRVARADRELFPRSADPQTHELRETTKPLARSIDTRPLDCRRARAAPNARVDKDLATVRVSRRGVQKKFAFEETML